MKRSIILILVAFCLSVPDHVNAQKKPVPINPHVAYAIDTAESDFQIRFRFMDPFGKLQEVFLNFPISQTFEMIDRFGVPGWIFEPYIDTPEDREQRRQILAAGLFRENHNTVEVDRDAFVTFYAPDFGRPIAEEIVRILSETGSDTRLNRIEIAMGFVQDIPYGIPKMRDSGKFYAGVITPPQILLEMYGDCDSKALLFASILVWLIGPEDIIFLNGKDHMLTAILGEPVNGDTFIRYKNKTYLLAETAGPGRTRLGEKGEYYSSTFTVEECKVPDTWIIPIQVIPPETITDKDKGYYASMLRILNTSQREFRIEVSGDGLNWQKLKIAPKHLLEISGFPVEGTLRILDSAHKGNREYDVLSGSLVNASWDSKKKKWLVISK